MDSYFVALIVPAVLVVVAAVLLTSKSKPKDTEKALWQYTRLPDNTIKNRWVKVSKEPAGNKVGKYSVIIGRAYWPEHSENSGIHSIHVAYVRDSPFLKHLNTIEGVPKAVKAIYKGSVRLRHLTSRNAADTVRDLDNAETKWANFIAKRQVETYGRTMNYEGRGPKGASYE